MSTYYYETNDKVEHECRAVCTAQAVAIARLYSEKDGLKVLWVGLPHAGSNVEVLWSNLDSVK